MKLSQSDSRIAIRQCDLELGPHEADDRPDDRIESHRNLINYRTDTDPSQYFSAEVYKTTDQGNMTSSEMLSDRRTFQNLPEIGKFAPGGVQ